MIVNYNSLTNVSVTVFMITFAITSNVFFSIPLKAISLVVVFLLFVIGVIIFKRIVRVTKKDIFCFILFSVFIVIWSVLGIANGFNTSVLQHALKITSFALVVYLLYILIQSGVVTVQKMYKNMWYVFVTAFIFKALLELSYISGMMSPNDVKSFLLDNFQMDTMLLGIADGTMIRIGLIVDAFPLSIFPFLFINASRPQKLFIFLAVTFMTLINFSRIYIVQVTLMAIILFSIELFKCNRKQRIALLFALFGFILFSYVFSMYTGLWESLTDRFGDVADTSDYIRVEQTLVLSNSINDNILIGKGIGAYISSYVRSEQFPFLYEVEYLALIYQVGLLGLIVLGCFFSVFISKFPWKCINKQIKLLIITNLIFFFIRPSSNPMLFATSSALILICLYSCATYHANNK